MANYYKDEAGHFTNKENDGGPCRHKRINNGKYEYSEDEGKSWKAFGSRDEYDKYDAKSWDFDENNDDDFGFDENDSDIYKEYDLNKDMISDKIFENFTLSEEIEPELVQQLMNFVDDEFGVRNVVEREQLVNDFLKEQGIRIAGEKEDKGFEGDPTEGMSKSDYIDYLENEKGWDHDEAVNHAKLFYEDKPQEEYKIYEDKIREELSKVRDKKSAEYVADLIDENTEAGYISDELSDQLYSELDKMIDKYVEGMPLYNSKKESSPMNEFSGPEGSELSYAQLESLYGKDFENKSKKFNEEDWHYNPESDTYSREPQPRKGLVKDTLVDKFDDAHLYNDGGKFQLALGDGSTKEFDSKNEAIDYLSEYSKRDYSWAKDKEEKPNYRTPEDLGNDFNTPSGFMNFKDIVSNRTDDFIKALNEAEKTQPGLKTSIMNIIKNLRQGK